VRTSLRSTAEAPVEPLTQPLLDGYRSVFLANTARLPNVSEFNGVQVPGVGDAGEPESLESSQP